MKSFLMFLLGSFIGGLACGGFVYFGSDNRFELGTRNGRSMAQVEIANLIGVSLGKYNSEEKAQLVDKLYESKGLSVWIIEKEGVRSLRLMN